MSVVRSIFAMIAGLAVVVVLSEGTDFVLRSAGWFPPLNDLTGYTNEMFALATVYRAIAGVIGGIVAASLAPRAPMAHALVLGGIGFVLSTAGAIAMWGVGPAWYPITLAVIALPSAWLGGWLVGSPSRAAA